MVDDGCPLATIHGEPLQRVVVALSFGFFAVIFVAQSASPGKGGTALSVISLVFAAGSLFLAVRAARGATMIVWRWGVEVRSLLRTRRWGWDELGSAEARIRPFGLVGWRRSMLALHLASGSVRRLTEMNVRPGSSGSVTSMDRAASYLNQMLEWHRGLSGAG